MKNTYVTMKIKKKHCTYNI